jgi:hypothetical protein
MIRRNSTQMWMGIAFMSMVVAIVFISLSQARNAPSNVLIGIEDINPIIFKSGNENSDIVIIYAQSGPLSHLNTGEFNSILSKIDSTQCLLVNVHQAQFKIDNQIETPITFEEAIKYDKESVENLYKVIQFYKQDNKKVYVMGISFGAFLVEELIAQYGIDLADKYLIMVGRLEVEDLVWKAMSQGKKAYFVSGVSPVASDEVLTDPAYINMGRLAGGLGENRYMTAFKSFDLSSVTYVYGKADEAVGSLSQSELDFLTSKNATVISTEGGHLDTIFGQLERGLDVAFGLGRE